MPTFVKYRRPVAVIAVVLGVGTAVYVASPAAQAAAPEPPHGTVAELQAEIDVLQQQLDQQALLLATKQDTIHGTCPEGEHLSQVNADGSTICTPGAVHATFLSETRHLNPFGAGDIFLHCPDGTAIAGGGFEQSNVGINRSEPFFLERVVPSSFSGWVVSGATNLGGGNFEAHAICLPYAP